MHTVIARRGGVVLLARATARRIHRTLALVTGDCRFVFGFPLFQTPVRSSDIQKKWFGAAGQTGEKEIAWKWGGEVAGAASCGLWRTASGRCRDGSGVAGPTSCGLRRMIGGRCQDGIGVGRWWGLPAVGFGA